MDMDTAFHVFFNIHRTKKKEKKKNVKDLVAVARDNLNGEINN